MEFFKETELQNSIIGKIPQRWQATELKECGKLVDGDWILKENYTDKGVRLLQVADVGVGKFINKSNRFISDKRAKELNCAFVKPNEDVLISRMPDPIGRACFAPNLPYPYIVAVDITIFSVSRTILDPIYAIQTMNSQSTLNEVRKFSSGATRQRISRANLEKILIPVPPLPEQRGIVEVLGVVDSAIELADKVIAKTERLKKGLMQQLLTHGIGHTEYKDTPIGKTPKTWQVEKLGNVITYEKGKAPKVLLSSPAHHTLPYLSAESLRTGSFTQWGEVTEEVVKVHEDDVLLIWDGFYCGDAFISYEGILSSTMIKIGTNENHLNKRFLFYILKTHFKELNTKISGMYLKHVNKHVFESLKMPIPPISEQQNIVEMLSQADKKLELERKEKSKLERIKLGLMDLLLTGKVRVKVD